MTEYKVERAINRWYDIIALVGGYPYEVATVDEIFDFYKKRGFSLTKVKSGGVGLECNEFIFDKTASCRYPSYPIIPAIAGRLGVIRD